MYDLRRPPTVDVVQALTSPARQRRLQRAAVASETAVRLAVASMLVWFGALKVIGVSAVADLVVSATAVLPFIRAEEAGLLVVGIVEVALGVWLAVGRPRSIALAAATGHLLAVSVFALVIRPDLLFQGGEFLALTVTGQFVVKNIGMLAATSMLTLRSLSDPWMPAVTPNSHPRYSDVPPSGHRDGRRQRLVRG